MSRLKATRRPTIPPAKPTSRNEKGITCGTLSEALVFFAISGMNNAVSVWYARPKSPESRDGDCIPASPALWVVRPVPRTVFYFIQSAMTGFTACVFPYPNRVSPNEAFEVLEPDDGKLSRPVLRGPGPSNGVRLLDPHVLCCLLRPSLTEAPSLRRSYPASSVLRTSPPPHTARPVSRELPVDPYHDHRWGFPCCVWSPMRTCHRHYPGRIGWSLSAHVSPSTAAFPVKTSGRLLQLFFWGLLSVHSRYGLHARRVAMRPSTPKAPTASLPPLPLRLLPGGANQFPGGSYTR